MSRTMLCPHIQIQVESQKRFLGCLLYKKEQKIKNGWKHQLAGWVWQTAR